MTVQRGTLKASLLKYLPACFIIMLVGMKLLTLLSEFMMKAYEEDHPVAGIVIRDGEVEWDGNGSRVVRWAIENVEYLLIPLWVVLCVAAAGYLFYTRELRVPIEKLMKASRKIAENDLAFSLRYEKNDEMGRLCTAFEEMRGKLFASNLEIWQTMEERRRLSAAFSHDLRTPLTVLGGYVELMQSYGEKLAPEKRAEILSKMEQQVKRLKSYTEQMNAVQKLEDIQPELTEVKLSALCSQIKDTGSIICADKAFVMTAPESDETVLADSGLVIRVCENLASNAVRFAKNEVSAEVSLDGDKLSVAFSDDGAGFSEEALRKADRPFYRGDKDSNQHFGLGLYICRLLCMKCGGGLSLANGENGGGRVTASFGLGKK